MRRTGRTRFFGSALLDSKPSFQAFGEAFAKATQCLPDLRGVKVEVKIDIQIDSPGAIPDDTRRIVRENAVALKFKDSEFEE